MNRLFSSAKSTKPKTQVSKHQWFGMEVEVHRKAMKTLRLKVNAQDGLVRISVPHYLPDSAVQQFMRNNHQWILQRKNELAQHIQPKLNFETGELHPLWGQAYTLQISHSLERSSIRTTPDQSILMMVPSKYTASDKEKLLDNLYRRQLKKAIPALLQKWQPIVGKEVDDWGIKKMRTRWGTCNIQAKRIWLSLELAKKHPDCLEYVLVHELVHLHERYHNQHFKDLMTRFLPNWKEREVLLNQPTIGLQTPPDMDL